MMNGVVSYIMEGLGSILVIAAASAIGFQAGSLPAKRLHALQEWRRLVLLLRGNLNYSALPIPEALMELASRCDGAYSAMLEQVAQRLDEREGQPISVIWNEELDTYGKQMFLREVDLMELRTLGASLGYLDRAMQLSSIELYLTRQESVLGELIVGISSKSKLYRTLGVMGGIFTVIVLI